MMELLNGPIQSIFIHICHADKKIAMPVTALRAVLISNVLYGYDVISAYGASKGYRRRLNRLMPSFFIKSELFEVHANLVARRKLTRILHWHSIWPSYFHTGDLIQVYVKHRKEKQGRLLEKFRIIRINAHACMLYVPGDADHSINVAFDNDSAAQCSSDITYMIHLACDQFDDYIEEILSPLSVG